jgi:hypothetical protein
MSDKFFKDLANRLDAIKHKANSVVSQPVQESTVSPPESPPEDIVKNQSDGTFKGQDKATMDIHKMLHFVNNHYSPPDDFDENKIRNSLIEGAKTVNPADLKCQGYYSYKLENGNVIRTPHKCQHSEGQKALKYVSDMIQKMKEEGRMTDEEHNRAMAEISTGLEGCKIPQLELSHDMDKNERTGKYICNMGGVHRFGQSKGNKGPDCLNFIQDDQGHFMKGNRVSGGKGVYYKRMFESIIKNLRLGLPPPILSCCKTCHNKHEEEMKKFSEAHPEMFHSRYDIWA